MEKTTNILLIAQNLIKVRELIAKNKGLKSFPRYKLAKELGLQDSYVQKAESEKQIKSQLSYIAAVIEKLVEKYPSEYASIFKGEAVEMLSSLIDTRPSKGALRNYRQKSTFDKVQGKLYHNRIEKANIFMDDQLNMVEDPKFLYLIKKIKTILNPEDDIDINIEE